MGKENLAKSKAWKRKLKAWKESGLSGPKWCKENGENYPQFRYWKHVFKMTRSKAIFEELKEAPFDPIELELRQGDITILFPKGCTPVLLNLCLQSLRKN